jgi:hypothetical protein
LTTPETFLRFTREISAESLDSMSLTSMKGSMRFVGSGSAFSCSVTVSYSLFDQRVWVLPDQQGDPRR